jgi:hypothetical protein
MDAHGDSTKQVWITEYGAESTGPISVGETAQSADLVQAISLVKGLSWVGSLYLYTWSDNATYSATANGFGLLTEANEPKPAYAAVASALASAG